MTEPIAGLLREAQTSLEIFARGPAEQAAQSVASAFERAGVRIGAALGRAALDGEAGFKRLAKTALEEIAKIALARLRLPSPSVSGTSLFGARAAGGSVTPGGAYLVGERGPELFTPASAGAITPLGGGGAVNVHFHLAAGAQADDLRRHQRQIAAEIARAVAYGRRGL